MLPLIPALLLLLLQGPTNVERLAHEGRLPAMLEAVHASLDRPVKEQREVLEKLLSATADTNLSQMFASLLALVIDEPEAVRAKPDLAERTPAPIDRSSPPIFAADFVVCRRSRDGP